MTRLASAHDKSSDADPCPEAEASNQVSRDEVGSRPSGSMLVLNTASNLVVLLIQTVLSILIARAIVSRFGMAAFGVIAIAQTFPNYTRMFTNNVTVSLLRFVVTRETQSRSADGDAYFTTGFVAIATACFGLMLAIPAVAPMVSGAISVPPGIRDESSVMLTWMLFAAAISVLQGPLQVAFASNQLFYLQNFLIATTKLMAASLLIFVLYNSDVTISVVGVYFFSVAAVTVIAIGLTGMRRQLLPFRLSKFRVGLLPPLLRFGGWVLVNDAAVLLFLSAPLVLVNRQLGPEPSGELGALMLVNSFIIMLLGAAINVITPEIYKLSGSDDVRGKEAQLAGAFRIILMLSGIPVVAACGAFGDLVHAWLGSELSANGRWGWLIIFSTWFGGVASTIALTYLRGRNRVATLSLFNFACALGFVFTLTAVFTWTDWGLRGMAFAFLCWFGLRGLVVAHVLLQRVDEGHVRLQWRASVPTIIAAGGGIATGQLLSGVLTESLLLRICLAIFLSVLVYTPLAVQLLPGNDRSAILGLIRSVTTHRSLSAADDSASSSGT